MRYTIDQKILESLLNVLSEQPYKQVAQLIAQVQQDIKPEVQDEDIGN